MRPLTCLFLASGLFAQAPQTTGDKNDLTIIVNPTFVMVPVTVTTRDGTIVSGLNPSDFLLLDNDKRQRFTADLTTHPLSLVIVVQATDNMEKMLPQVQKLGNLLEAQVLGEEGEAAIIGFDHRIQKLIDFTSDATQLTNALKKLKPGSKSSRLNDATMEGIRLLKSRPGSRRRALLVIAEPHDKGSELRVREVLSEADFAGVAIYTVNVSSIIANATTSPSPARSVLDNRPPGAVHLPAGEVETPTTQSQNAMGNWIPLFKEVFTSAVDVFKKNPSEIYTEYTGGRGFPFGNQKELDRALTSIGEELHTQYLLTYSPNNQNEAGFHNIVVQVTKPDLKIRARDGYYIAGKPQ
jgi:VWFA-related protein